MTKLLSSYWLRTVAVVLALSISLGWMVWAQAQILLTGKEAVLKTVPIDPRSMFRGHYARLNFTVSRIDRALVKGGDKVRRGDVIYVRIKPDADGFWQVDEAALTPLAGTGESAVLKGRVRWSSTKQIRIQYGIERYFAPKAEALKLERQFAPATKRQIGVVVRVDGSGKAAISGLKIDGKKVYDEPLF